MLESMRNHAQSWIAKVILGGIALSFALWGVGDYFLGSRVAVVAEVDGKPVSDSEFIQAYQRQLNAYRASFGGNLPKELIEQLNIKEDSLQTLINRRLMLDEATRLGLTAPKGALLSTIQADPTFQSADGFDTDRYRNITYAMGFATTRDYEDEERLNLLVNALQRAVMNSARVGDKEIRDYFDREFETRELAAIVVEPENLLNKVSIDDTQARAFYDAHQDDYQSPLRLKLVAVEIAPGDLASDIIVEEDEISAAFERRQTEFGDKGLADVRQQIVEELRNRKAAEEAYRLSEDLDNALGMEGSLKAAADMLNLPLREIAAISATEALGDALLGSDRTLRNQTFSSMPGDAVNIIALDDGRFVAVEVIERIEPTTLGYADVAAQVYEDARRAEAETLAAKLAQEILAAAAAGKPLDALAQQFGQPKYISKPLRSSGIGADETPWLTSAMIDQAFRAGQGEWLKAPISISKGLAVVQVQQINAPSEAEFEAQKESLRREVSQAKGAVRFARWMASVRDRHEINIRRDILDRL